ncbi:hypothetical protein [Nitratifractor sp.]
MRLPPRYLAALINLLLGVAWATVALGALGGFLAYRPLGFVAGLVHALVWAVPGLFLVVILEAVFVSFRRYEELRRQSRILEEIRRELSGRRGV